MLKCLKNGDNKSINQTIYIIPTMNMCEEQRQQINKSNKLKYAYHAEVYEELEMPGKLWRGWEDESRQSDNI